MFLESAISTIATLIAAGYAAHKIENAFLARKGYDTRNFFKPDPLPAPEPTLAVPLWTIEDDRRQAQAFIDCPTAFWLDPNFFGDFPDWREKLFAPERVQQAPRLGEKGHIDPVREQQALMYGVTRMTAPAIYYPQNTFRAVMTDSILPCGCDGPIHKRDAFTTVCRTCHSEWEARSNDPSRRSLGQGEIVFNLDRCPAHCKTDQTRTVTADHGGKPSMWMCKCGVEYTARGETRSSKKRRKGIANRHDYDNDLPLPPSME